MQNRRFIEPFFLVLTELKYFDSYFTHINGFCVDKVVIQDTTNLKVLCNTPFKKKKLTVLF